MKKLLSILLVMVLALGALAIPALADTFISNNVQLTPVRAAFFDYGGNDVSLRIYMRVVNNNSFPVTVLVQDVEVNGVKVDDSAISGVPANGDTGADSDEYFLFKPEFSSDSAAAEALRNASTVKMRFQCYNKDTYEDLFIDTFTMSLAEIDMQRTDRSDDYVAPDTGSYDDTSSYDYYDDGNTAPAYTPKSTNYQTLKQGSKGQAVRDLQQRLTDLGYLNDKVDGSFGRNTCTAVRCFCEQNGLPIASQATPEMQELLYSSSAKYYVEPYLPLMIAGSYIVETPLDLGLENGFLEVELVNRSPDTAIRGYVLSFYQTDMYGKQINLSPNGGELYHYEMEMMKYIEPGHYLNAKDAYPYAINKFYSTYAVYVGVKTVVMEDGDVRDIDLDDVTYFECRVAN